MTFKNFICKGVLVFTGLLLIGWLGQYIYMVNGEIDWFRLMLVYGVPVGIPHMFIIVPWHWDLSGILGMVALCVIVGGVFGCVIAAGLAIRAIWYIVGQPVVLFCHFLMKEDVVEYQSVHKQGEKKYVR